jgi:hypothetical protein
VCRRYSSSCNLLEKCTIISQNHGIVGYGDQAEKPTTFVFAKQDGKWLISSGKNVNVDVEAAAHDQLPPIDAEIGTSMNDDIQT